MFSAFASKSLFVVVFVSLLAACASSPKISERYRLQPLETSDQSKRFTYGFSVRGPGGGQQQPGGGAGGPGGEGGSGGGDQRSGSGGQGGGQAGGQRQQEQIASFDDMRDELENYMAVTQFCTQGYFIYDETFDGVQYLLHGECQESKDDE